MVTYNQLKKEFNKKVESLQSSCKHKNLTPWLEEWWAPGHSTGNVVKICRKCNKVIKKTNSSVNH